MIDKGSSYQNTIEKTGVSTATIGRVKRCLEYGTGGYRLILKRLRESESKDES
jgi:TrpR-related protein YerC/YecD